jgi:hypothetical protein
MKLAWEGDVVSVQPRIRLMRSFDQRSHTYLGYALCLCGAVGGETRNLSVGIGKAAQSKFGFRAGDRISGEAEPVADPRLDPVELYKVAKLTLLARATAPGYAGPPWTSVPPALEVYRARGHRRLDVRTYEAKCATCIWGCRMPVEMIIDQWNPSVREHRFETFCYGPKSCPLYRAGPTRKVPGRKGMNWEEEDWVDEEATAHRGPDE